ncbi:GPN-loop GTPase 3-like, partial [Limulus polyphemus]|uniref:GPN-loop GTPase 3 n=1 Tax=Limulus polyphemus TaxID=6850 RepID=A0ABM1C202_LIMPO
STYCKTIIEHATAVQRSILAVNLDPAAEHFDYEVMADIRELIHLDDAMEDEELRFGPNGGLVFCMEYLVENSEWLKEQLGEDSDDYILFDCPGQIELYTHMNVMRRLVNMLHSMDFQVCAVFLLDSQFMIDASKFFSGVMTALATMVNLEIPHINVLSKVDLLDRQSLKQLSR